MTETAQNIIVIPAHPETAKGRAAQRQPRVAAYCRVSTKDEEHHQLRGPASLLHRYDHEEPQLDDGGHFCGRGDHRHLHRQTP